MFQELKDAGIPYAVETGVSLQPCEEIPIALRHGDLSINHPPGVVCAAAERNGEIKMIETARLILRHVCD